MRDKGLECHIPVAFTSSETLHDYQRNLIEKTFHTQIYDHYGTTERTIRLEESFDHDGYFEDPGYGIEEYHDDYVITTSLINDTFPLIRYKTNDRVVLKPNTILTHASEPMVKRVEGRSVSFIIGKDGTKYSDAALTFIFKEAYGVRLAQFVQNEVGKIFLNVVPESNFSEKDKDEILKNIDQKIGKENIDVDFRLIDESQMQYSKRNKLALVISNL